MKKAKSHHTVSTSSSLAAVLIAGGAGFIGSHLSKLLLEQNCHVYCLDNLLSGKKENIDDLLDKKEFEFIDYDLTKPLGKLNLPSIDYVFHLAGIENHLGKKEISLQTLTVNSLGTKNLLQLAKNKNSKFLLGSSLAIFSGMASSQQLETYFGKKENSQSFYSLAEAKRFSETLVFEYFKKHNLDCRIVRVVDPYGPAMSLNIDSQINNLFNHLIQNQSLKVIQDGSQIIYPTYISDLIYGFLKAMFDQQSSGKIYTLADAKGITVLDFSHLLKKVSDLDLEIEFVSDKAEDRQVEKEDIIKSQEDISWYPKVKLEDGIKKTYDWLKENKAKTITKTKVDNKSFLSQAQEIEEIKPLVRPLGITGKIKNKFLSKQAKVKKIKPKNQIKPFNKINKTDKSKLRQKLIVKIINRIKTKNNKRKNILKIIIFIFIFSLMVILLPAISFFYQLEKGLRQIDKQEYPKAILSLEKSKRVLIEFNWLTALPFLKKQREKILSFLDLGINVLQAENIQIEAKNHFINLLKIVVNGKRGDPDQEIKTTSIYLDQIYQNLSLVEGEIAKLEAETEKNFLLNKLEKRLADFKNQAPDLRQKIDQGRQVIRALPEILSFNEKKVYLVLIQDSMELRPTGGFITSYGWLSFEKGKLLDFEVKDIDMADSKLKGRIIPPEEIETYLNETNWYLRDSNWSPDFPQSANQAELFLSKAMGEEVDGVIALNSFLIKEVLSQIGPIQFINDNETIDADNFFTRAIYYSEVDFSANQDEQKFLTRMVETIFKKLKQIDGNTWFDFFAACQKGLDEKDLLIKFNNRKINQLVQSYGWDGAIRRQTLNNEENKLVDYLMLVESNLGVNKVNYFLKRSLNHNVTILENGSLLETLTVIYKNTSTSQGWPAGEYKNYLRIYIPANSSVISIKTGKDGDSLIELASSKFRQYDEFGKQVIGFLVQIPAKEDLQVQLTYRQDNQFDFSLSQGSYIFYWQKQPGMTADPLALQINLAENIKPLKIAPKANLSGSKIIFNTDILKDRLFVVDFIK